MGLEMEVESVIKKVKVAANSIKDPNNKIAILSLTKITENMLKRIKDLETQLYILPEKKVVHRVSGRIDA